MQIPRRIKRFLTAVYFFVFSGILSGCIDVMQEIWIDADGGGRCSFQLAIPETIVKLSGKNSFAEMLKQANESSNEEVEIITASDTVIDDRHYYNYHIKTKDINDCLVQEGDITIDLAQLESGKTSFNQTLYIPENQITTFTRNLAEKTETFEGVTELNQAILSSMLKDHYWNVVLHVPGEITSTNGDYDSKTNRTLWRIPMNNIYGLKAKPVYLKLEYLPPGQSRTLTDLLRMGEVPPLLIGGFIVVSFLLLSLVVLFVIVMKKSKRKSPEKI